MKIEKLKNTSSSYRIRKTYKGVTYQIVVPYKPTQKEAMQLMAEKMGQERTETGQIETFEACAIKYMSAREKVLSPSTLRGYKIVLNGLSESFRNERVSDITQNMVQAEINAYAKSRTPKSVKNAKSFMCSVIRESRPSAVFNITLPQASRTELYIPTPEEVKKLLKECEGRSYYVAVVLACYGLRRSEICAITADDVDGNILHVSKAKVRTEDGWVIKQPKTTTSDRYIEIPQDIADMIKEKGYAFDGYPELITEYLHYAQKRAGIPKFRLHDLRHFFCTELSQAQYSDKDIMYLSGHSTDYTLRRIYQHQRIDKDKEARHEASETIGRLIL